MQIIQGIRLVRWLNQIVLVNSNYSASEINSRHRRLVDSPGLPRPWPQVQNPGLDRRFVLVVPWPVNTLLPRALEASSREDAVDVIPSVWGPK
jgi:hypothetical protein